MDQLRIETDSMGQIAIPADNYWGAQTQRSLQNFAIGRPFFVWPRVVIRALGLIKQAAAESNAALGLLNEPLAAAIVKAAAEVARGEHDQQFPLVVFQTGSGTHTNMNANEVIASRASELLGGPRGQQHAVHPNDHVNCGQSSNDIFPAAMHLSVVLRLHEHLLPAVAALQASVQLKASAFSGTVKSGRTHLQDAAPMLVEQEFGAWHAQLEAAVQTIQLALPALLQLPLGATAVGTGLNTHAEFGFRACNRLAVLTGHDFRQASNLFMALSSHEAMLQLSAALRTLATALFKIANDVRWLASGPRGAIGEIRLPANEPGSSIMPGKVNPSQCEALTMVCAQVIGNDAAIAFACTQGNFQLNAFKPVILHNVLQSIDLLGDACRSFDQHCMRGLQLNRARIEEHLQNNLMLVTALAPHLGYDAAARIAHDADLRGLSLREAALQSRLLSEEQYDQWVVPADMACGGANRT